MGVVTLADLQRPTPDPLAAFNRGDYGAASERLQQQILQKLLTEGPWVKDLSEEEFAAWLQCCQAIKATGSPSWYEWCVVHWGTKWNAYEAYWASPTRVIFQTANGPPLPVLRALVARYPGWILEAAWADEDFGNNTGHLIIAADGTLTGGPYPSNSPEALALAARLLPGKVLADD